VAKEEAVPTVVLAVEVAKEVVVEAQQIHKQK
jgi:hypothetical protein